MVKRYIFLSSNVLLVFAIVLLLLLIPILFFVSTNAVAQSQQQSVPPILMTQVELSGPGFMAGNDFDSSFLTSDVACRGALSSSGMVWIELTNHFSDTIRLNGYTLKISGPGVGFGSDVSFRPLEIDPNQRCTIDVTYPRLLTIPSEPRNITITFEYEYAGKKYQLSTPPLTDTFKDSRTWQLENTNNNNSRWVFREGKVPDIERVTINRTTEDGSILANITLPKILRNDTTATIKLDFVNATTMTRLNDVKYRIDFTGSSIDADNRPILINDTGNVISGVDFKVLHPHKQGSLVIGINIESANGVQFNPPKSAEFPVVVVPEFTMSPLVAGLGLVGPIIIAFFSMRKK